MSKKYKGKLCVYCTKNPSTTADHVVAREFFLKDRRENLPKVPACQSCNKEKSDLEHYLTTVLPFGGRHPDAHANLTTMVPKRLRKNAKLHQDLSSGVKKITNAALSSVWEYLQTMSIPIEPSKIETLFTFIAKGLAWHHWKVLLGTKDAVTAAVISNSGAPLLNQLLFSRNSHARVNMNLGEGTFSYEGLQATDYAGLTIWRFSFYGGLCFAEGAGSALRLGSQVFAATGPEVEIRNLELAMSGKRANKQTAGKG